MEPIKVSADKIIDDLTKQVAYLTAELSKMRALSDAQHERLEELHARLEVTE